MLTAVSGVIVDMLVASDTSTSQCSADGNTDKTDDDKDEDSFEQLFEQLRVMKGFVCYVFISTCHLFRFT